MRISVTDLDSFRYFKASEEMDLAELLSRLRREEPPSPAMLAGRALHKVLETASWESADTAEADGYKFHFRASCEIAWLPVRELKGEIMLPSPAGPVTLVGVIDGLDGAIYDHKLTKRFDAERYADSYQWRCYLTMFGAKKFVYNVFEGEQDETGDYNIWGFHRFQLYAYEGMRNDVLREVGELAELIAKHIPERRAA